MKSWEVLMVVQSALRVVAVVAAAGLSWGPAAAAWAADPRHTSPIQVSDDGTTVWVANPDSDSVGKIATASNLLAGEYPVGDNPRTLALGGGAVYVAN
jgi:DNA-binding beta-propeller fold protein YncE